MALRCFRDRLRDVRFRCCDASGNWVRAAAGAVAVAAEAEAEGGGPDSGGGGGGGGGGVRIAASLAALQEAAAGQTYAYVFRWTSHLRSTEL